MNWTIKNGAVALEQEGAAPIETLAEPATEHVEALLLGVPATDADIIGIDWFSRLAGSDLAGVEIVAALKFGEKDSLRTARQIAGLQPDIRSDDIGRGYLDDKTELRELFEQLSQVGISQREVARRLGISDRTIRYWINPDDRRTPSYAEVIAIETMLAQALTAPSA